MKVAGDCSPPAPWIWISVTLMKPMSGPID
jgi:hypothetical protein